jgi:hypothetical protein
VLSHGGFSSLGEFQHESENYVLAAGIYVDRESLLQRTPRRSSSGRNWYLNGIPVTLSLLEDVRLTITSRDREGRFDDQGIADFELFEDRESVRIPGASTAAFDRVPTQAKVQNLSQNKKIDLSVSESFSLNEIDGTDKVEDLHLVLIDGQYALDVLGRTGESRSDRPVRLTLKHRDFKQPVQVTLKTDPQGRVLLGALPDIVTLTAQGPEDTAHTWNLWQPGNTLSEPVARRVGERWCCLIRLRRDKRCRPADARRILAARTARRHVPGGSFRRLVPGRRTAADPRAWPAAITTCG